MSNQKINKTAYIENGEVFFTATDKAVKDLALMIDIDSDVLLSYGDPETVNQKLNALTDKAKTLFGNLAILQLKTDNFTAEQRCYVIRRAVEYTATGFCKALAEHAKTGDFTEWLNAEMAKLPLDLSK